VPATAGSRQAVALGYLLRLVKRLPAPVQERVLAALLDGDGPLPPFADMLRSVEIARGLPPRRRWQRRLLAEQPRLRGVRVDSVAVTATATTSPARRYLPPVDQAHAGAALVWVHGGGFFLGDLDGADPHWVALSVAACGVPVVALDYRLCRGGVHYPAPLDDVAAGWEWALAHADRLGVEPGQLHLGGASAGAALALGVALRLRDAQQPQPASLLLAYPQLYLDSPPATPEAADVLPLLAAGELNEDVVHGSFLNYLGATVTDDPYAIPTNSSAAGLAPTLVVTCARDYLRLHSEAYVAKLQAEDVVVRHELLPDAGHGVLDFPESKDGLQALDRLTTWLTDHGSVPPPNPGQIEPRSPVT
jgi:acetyl esterase